MATTTVQRSGEEEQNYELYSDAVHKFMVSMNTVVLGFLQLGDPSAAGANTTSSAFVLFETYRTTFLCYWVLILIYALLRIYEIKLRSRWFRMLVGHISHLFGSLAPLLLVSVISPIFSLIVAPVWLVWLSTVLYIAFRELKNPRANSSGEVELTTPRVMTV
ncbi:PREDICTED: uncharacterized protein LOC109127455 [Camelina sativa]|uniref:Uncharacterized protein LOC109127455 n=1 Tax=Camelina sativa TaxID=90675 RepID=A0ABM1QLQ2_CAMSA|nr:PREDICTED: uncharacterized protein LOC109127455 [Camelina sativa]